MSLDLRKRAARGVVGLVARWGWLPMISQGLRDHLGFEAGREVADVRIPNTIPSKNLAQPSKYLISPGRL